MKQNKAKYKQAGLITTQVVSAILLVLGFGWFTLAIPAEIRTTARILDSGKEIEITSHGERGPYKTTVPVYQSGGVRYFSTGVGSDQREAEYPPFPLKLIFVEGQRALTSRVRLVIDNKAGTLRVDIPAEHVSGPWLFIDLPTDTYAITATRKDQVLTRPSVAISREKVRSMYLRWPEKG